MPPASRSTARSSPNSRCTTEAAFNAIVEQAKTALRRRRAGSLLPSSISDATWPRILQFSGHVHVPGPLSATTRPPSTLMKERNPADSSRRLAASPALAEREHPRPGPRRLPRKKGRAHRRRGRHAGPRPRRKNPSSASCSTTARTAITGGARRQLAALTGCRGPEARSATSI